MKRRITTLLLVVGFLQAGCVKDLLKKKDDPNTDDPNKYAGVWKATAVARDINSNNLIDANEKGPLNGSSELKINDNATYTYFISAPGSATVNLSGNWKRSDDKKSISITDNVQGSLRFDIISNTELNTEPILSGNETLWLIYTR